MWDELKKPHAASSCFIFKHLLTGNSYYASNGVNF